MYTIYLQRGHKVSVTSQTCQLGSRIPVTPSRATASRPWNPLHTQCQDFYSLHNSTSFLLWRTHIEFQTALLPVLWRPASFQRQILSVAHTLLPALNCCLSASKSRMHVLRPLKYQGEAVSVVFTLWETLLLGNSRLRNPRPHWKDRVTQAKILVNLNKPL